MSRQLEDRVLASSRWAPVAGVRSRSGCRLQDDGSWMNAAGELLANCPGDAAPDLTDAATVGILRQQAAGDDDIDALVTQLETR